MFTKWPPTEFWCPRVSSSRSTVICENGAVEVGAAPNLPIAGAPSALTAGAPAAATTTAAVAATTPVASAATAASLLFFTSTPLPSAAVTPATAPDPLSAEPCSVAATAPAAAAPLPEPRSHTARRAKRLDRAGQIDCAPHGARHGAMQAGAPAGPTSQHGASRLVRVSWLTANARAAAER